VIRMRITSAGLHISFVNVSDLFVALIYCLKLAFTHNLEIV